MVVLGPRDLGAAQTAGHLDLDAAGAELHRASDRLLHGAAEGDAGFQLGGDRLGHELGVLVGGLDLDDVDEDLALVGRGLALVDHLVALAADLLDLGAAPADDDARAGAVDVDAHLGGVALDFNAGDSCIVKGFL